MSSSQRSGPPTSARNGPLRVIGGSIRRLYTDATKLDRTQSDPVVAGRNALGLVIPLAIGGLLGHPGLGVQSAIGALQTAFADRPGPYRLRMARMLTSALAAGLTAALAAGFGHSLALSALLLAVCAFSAGLLVMFGPSAAQVGVAATGCALILGHIPERPLAAIDTGLLVFAGGVVQMLLAITAWPLRRHGPERRALAGLYRELADLAAEPIDSSVSPPLGETIAQTRAVLTGAGRDHGPSVEAYRVLLDEAVRARQDILALSAYADRLEVDGNSASAATLYDALTTAASVLARIADALAAGRTPGEREYRETLEIASGIGRSEVLGESLTERAAADRRASLVSQLRAMVQTARTGAGEGSTDEDVESAKGVRRLRDPIAVLRANLDVRSPALRYAVRLGVLVPLTDILTRVGGFDRGYWISLTILVVLRPDFGATFQRSLQRVIGTLIGLLLASVIVHYLLGDGVAPLILLVGIFFFGMRLAGPNNMGLSSICLSALVVALLSIAGIPAHTTVVDRAVATVIGGAIALLASLLFPTWERSQVADRLTELMGAYRDYLQTMVDPRATAAQRSSVRSRSRLARSNAEASLDRARSEPVNSQGILEVGGAVLANSHRLVHALTAIDATRRARDAYRDVPQFRDLVTAVLQQLHLLQGALQGEEIKEKSTLRRFQVELAAAYADLLPGVPIDRAAEYAYGATVIEATDRLVDSVDTITAVLHDAGDDLRLTTAGGDSA
ncbi:Uncharacterized membrane protein YccC [Frankineae bacterium MT45]|nr:Uncharacterized membrane protein YccC [Frankineae bacterium MT45]